jgi:hypothetical protein
MAAVFLDIEKVFDTTWHSGLLYKLSKLEFSNSITKLTGSFLSERKFRVSVESEMSTPIEMPAGYYKVLYSHQHCLTCTLKMPPIHMVFTWPTLKTTPV